MFQNVWKHIISAIGETIDLHLWWLYPLKMDLVALSVEMDGCELKFLETSKTSKRANKTLQLTRLFVKVIEDFIHCSP